MKVGWSGYYTEEGSDERYDYDIDHMVFDVETGVIEGIESRDRGGNRLIKGVVHPNRDVVFSVEMVVDETSSPTMNADMRVIEFHGKLENEVIEGTIKIMPEGISGNFSLRMKRSQYENWKGYYMSGGVPFEMIVNMQVDQDGVFGVGRDSNLHFALQGKKDLGTDSYRFVKKYFDTNVVSFVGRLLMEDGMRVLKGRWSFNGVEDIFEFRDIPTNSNYLSNYPPKTIDYSTTEKVQHPQMEIQNFFTTPSMTGGPVNPPPPL